MEDHYFLTFEQAKAAKIKIDFDAILPVPAPKILGTTVIDTVTIADIVPYIEWNPFFKLGSFEVVTPIMDTQRFLMMQQLVWKPRNCLMMLRL